MSIKIEILNKYAKTFDEIQQFNKNTLSYVGIAFQFDTIIDFDNNQPSFYSKVKSKYPHKDARTASQGSFMLTIAPENNQFGFNQQSEQYTEYIYGDDKENPKIRFIVNKKKIDFQCINPQNNYSTFGSFLDSIIDVLSDFHEVYSENLNLMSVTLRKINKIELNDKISYLNKALLYEPNIFENYSNMNSYKEFSAIGESEEIIEFKSGIIKNKKEENGNLIIYDFAIRQDNPNRLNLDNDTLRDMLKEFSRKIYNLYCYCIGDDYIKEVLNK